MNWESLRDELKEEKFKKGPACGVRTMLDSLPDNARKTVLAVLEDPGVQTSGLYRVLTKRLGDNAPTRHVLARHRRGECACERKG